MSNELELDMESEISSAVYVDLPEISVPKYEPMKEGEVAGDYNCIVLDTINELQDMRYIQNINSKGKPQFQDYIDLNTELKVVIEIVKKIAHECVLIIGPEGTGKSFGVKYLDPRKTVWLNVDKKLPTFKGGRANYSAKKRNMITNISSYDSLHKTLDVIKKSGSKEEPIIAFLLGHQQKDKDTGRDSLKTIGKFSEKLNLQGAFTNCYYTGMAVGDEGHQFYLDTQNTGNNSGRCLEELFPTRYIPNNLEYIRKKLINY